MNQQQLVIIEPLQRPTEHIPIPSWPAWLVSRENALVVAPQIDAQTHAIRDMITLPADQMLTDSERNQLKAHRCCLSLLLAETPVTSDRADKIVFAAISEMILAKPSPFGTVSPEGIKARASAYLAALDDVPPFALLSAIRRWHRGECGNDERGRPYDYRRAPESAELRRVTIVEIYRLKAELARIDRLLAAVAFVDCNTEIAAMRADGHAAFAALAHAVAEGDDPPPTFAKAVERGRAILTQVGEQRFTPRWMKKLAVSAASTEEQ